MVYKKAKQRVRRVYSRGKSLFGGDILKNPAVIGTLAGIIKNAATGKKIIDIESIKQRISKVDGSNPLIFLGVGIAMRNPALTAIGAYALVDPPDEEKKEEMYRYSNIRETQQSTGYSNVGKNEEPVVEYSNIGENEKTEQKKRCVY